jgi:hypothetical protein
MEVQSLVLTFEDMNLSPRFGSKLRGYIAGKFPQYDLLHNHKDQGYIYDYPKIQYKIIDNIPMIIAINEGVELLQNIFLELDFLKLDDREIPALQKELVVKKERWHESETPIRYRFTTPWLALNEKNFKNFMDLESIEKKQFLGKILIGNILSISKKLNYTVKTELTANISLAPIWVNFKNKKMIAFTGTFKINFNIPDYWGIGKSVSRGFGTVVRDIG